MQDHASGIDQRPQRVAQRLTKFVLHRFRQTRERKLQRIVVQQSRCDFLPQPVQHGARCIATGSWP